MRALTTSTVKCPSLREHTCFTNGQRRTDSIPEPITKTKKEQFRYMYRQCIIDELGGLPRLRADDQAIKVSKSRRDVGDGPAGYCEDKFGLFSHCSVMQLFLKRRGGKNIKKYLQDDRLCVARSSLLAVPKQRAK